MPTYTTTTGYTLTYRILPPDFLPGVRAKVRAELDARRPAPPTIALERAPGMWDDVPLNPDGELPDDPDLAARIVAYRDALAAWEADIVAETTRRVQRIMTRTISVPLDHEAVALVRELYAETATPLDGESDDYVMLWYVALPNVADQIAVTQALQGVPVEEAAATARQLFRRELERATVDGLSRAAREGAL